VGSFSETEGLAKSPFVAASLEEERGKTDAQLSGDFLHHYSLD
jgi:hypothetical protein